MLRVADGKDRAIILDHVGNYERHGMPDDDREWTLHARQKRKTVELSKYKRCPACQRADISRTDKACPFCGYVFSTNVGEGRIPKQVDGKLVEIKKKPVKEYTVYKIGDRVTIDARRRGEAEYIYLVAAKSIKQAIWMVYNKYPRRQSEGIAQVTDYTGRTIWPKEARQ